MKKAAVWGLALAALAAVLWHFGADRYRSFKEQRAARNAGAYLAAGDLASASLAARDALRLNSQNVQACRVMAELADSAGSSNAVAWRHRVAALEPALENQLRLAASAIRYEMPPFPSAAEALARVGAASHRPPAYHVLSAERALKLGDLDTARVHFQAARAAEPGNDLHSLNLAVLGLRSTNEPSVAAARQELQRLQRSPTVGLLALRWLVDDALGRSANDEAAAFSARLIALPESETEDRIRWLSSLRQSGSPEFGPSLGAAQARAATNAFDVYMLSAWMGAQGLGAEAIEWLTNCPPGVLEQEPARMALLDAYVARQDWSGIETCFANEQWAGLDFIRFAYLARAASEQGQARAAALRWRSAVRAAGDRLPCLTALARLAGAWGLADEREALLWRIAERYPAADWALRDLHDFHLAAGNTRALHRVYELLARHRPDDFAARNNFAATSLLLGLKLPAALEAARDLYARHSTEPIVVSTYAYALHLHNRSAEGLAALEKLAPGDLEQPSVALYYAQLLAHAGHRAKAARHAALAGKANLLPEERELLQRLTAETASGGA